MKTLILESIQTSVEEIADKSASILKKGGIVIFPTETVYGIGADAFNTKAVDKVFEIKKRAKDNPLIFHVFSEKMIEEIGEINQIAKKIIKEFWPGPLTIVLKSKIDKKFTFGLDTIAVRMPENLIALKIIEKLGNPIVAPSANISGKPSSTDFEHVYHDFYGKVDCIINGGNTVYGIESTVIDVTEREAVLLRPGSLAIEEIEKLGIKVIITEAIELKKRSPGTRYRHYAPDIPVILFQNKKELLQILEENRGKKIGYMGLYNPLKTFEKTIVFKSLEEYGRMLFSTLRYFDAQKLDLIIAQLPEKKGLGRAISDRLLRASEAI
ncbi:MAG: L-threonylcarbamoyladenylate synthase [Proteobacteria bacterium]|nr:L-threonylcarbamoyladenylate synthase [Pseudomonadota bacterium]